MKSTPIRLLLLVIFAGGMFIWVQRVRDANAPDEVALPKNDPRDFPLEIGDWRGEKQELDPEIFEAVGASFVSDRVYRNSMGKGVSVHMAVFMDYRSAAVHNPNRCYRAHGHDQLNSDIVTFKTKEGKSLPVCLSRWNRHAGGRIQTLYWYQIGDQVVHDRVGMGTARWALRGQKVWPPMIKVLLHTEETNPQHAEDRLREMATIIYDWLNKEPTASDAPSTTSPDAESSESPAESPAEQKKENETTDNPAETPKPQDSEKNPLS